ncbi:hypothetical protein TrRE_jg4632, partial [Triparma retinervis]
MKSTVEVPESAPPLTAQTLLLVPLVFILLKSSSIVPQLFPALHPILSTTLSLVPICAVPPLIPIAAPSWTKSLLSLCFYGLIGLGTPISRMLSSPGPLLRVTSTLGINYVLTRAVTRGMKEDETLQVLTTSNALVGGTGTAVQMATAWEGGSGGVGLKRVAVGVGTFGYISGMIFFLIITISNIALFVSSDMINCDYSGAGWKQEECCVGNSSLCCDKPQDVPVTDPVTYTFCQKLYDVLTDWNQPNSPSSTNSNGVFPALSCSNYTADSSTTIYPGTDSGGTFWSTSFIPKVNSGEAVFRPVLYLFGIGQFKGWDTPTCAGCNTPTPSLYQLIDSCSATCVELENERLERICEAPTQGGNWDSTANICRSQTSGAPIELVAAFDQRGLFCPQESYSSPQPTAAPTDAP